MSIVRPSRCARERQIDSDGKWARMQKGPIVSLVALFCLISCIICVFVRFQLRSLSLGQFGFVFSLDFFYPFLSNVRASNRPYSHGAGKCKMRLFSINFRLSFFPMHSQRKQFLDRRTTKKKKIHRNMYQVGALMQMCAIQMLHIISTT